MNRRARKITHHLSIAPALALLALLGFTGCAPQDRATADAWLKTMAGTANENIEGRWSGPLRGYGILGQQPFGIITLTQDGSTLMGQMPDYEVIGAVNGKSVLLVGLNGDKVYYTFHLTLAPRLKPPTMLGKICYGYHPEPGSKCNGIEFRKR